MTSKDIIYQEIDVTTDALEIAKKENNITIIMQCEEDIKKYYKVIDDLHLLELLKMLIVIEENKKYTLGNGRYRIRIRNDILYEDSFAKDLKERLDEGQKA